MSRSNSFTSPGSNVIALRDRRTATAAEPQALDTPARIIDFVEPGAMDEAWAERTANQLRCEVEQVITAIAANRMEVFFQPQFALGETRLVGLEALVRLRGDDGGLLNTARVVTLAEQHDIIGVLGRRAIELAVTQFSRSAFAGSEVRLSLNCSPLELSNRGYCVWLTSLLSDARLQPQQVELELTENTPIDLTSPQPEQLQALHDAGISIAVDDFGCGFANWQRVLTLPTATVKLDRAIVANVLHCDRTRRLINHLVCAGQDLGYRLIAEGIESTEQLEVLMTAGCDLGQGFGLGRPAPLSTLERLLR